MQSQSRLGWTKQRWKELWVVNGSSFQVVAREKNVRALHHA